jgi:hypothetical protein
METGDAVALGEAGDAGADFLDEAGYVVTAVDGLLEPEWDLPVLRVGSLGGCVSFSTQTSILLR